MPAGALLPRSGRLAAFVDGAGKRSAAGREAGDLLSAFSGGSGRFRSVAENHSETRRQPVGIGRGDHPRSQPRPFSEKEKTSSRSSTTGSMTRVGRSSMPWNRKSRYNVPSIPRAGNFTGSSANRPADPPNHPQIPPTRQKTYFSANCICRMLPLVEVMRPKFGLLRDRVREAPDRMIQHVVRLPAELQLVALLGMRKSLCVEKSK